MVSNFKSSWLDIRDGDGEVCIEYREYKSGVENHVIIHFDVRVDEEMYEWRSVTLSLADFIGLFRVLARINERS